MNLTKTRVPLYELAHARTGDKGNRSNISVIAYRPEDFAILLREVTAEKVREHFSFRKPSDGDRSQLNGLLSLHTGIFNCLSPLHSFKFDFLVQHFRAARLRFKS